MRQVRSRPGSADGRGIAGAPREAGSRPLPRPLWLTLSRQAGLAGLLLLVGGCMVGPDYETPEADITEDYLGSGDSRVKVSEPVEIEWWKTLNDPVLDSLVEDAYRQNLSLRAAAMRVLQSMAERGIAVGALFPQSQEAYGSYSRSKSSDSLGLSDSYRSSWNVGFDAYWELDLWGKIRRNLESADAVLDANLAGYDNVMVSLVSEVAATYVQIRTLETRIEIAKTNVDIQTKSLDLAQQRFDSGANSELDVAQGKAALERTKSAIPDFEATLTQSLRRLNVLLGTAPQDLSERLSAGSGIPTAPTEIAVGVPADLLRRRPDVRLAERQAAALSAQIGVAAAELYPSFFLSGSLGLSAANASDLASSGNWTGAITPGFSWPILNYGRLKNNVRAQDAAFQAAIFNYQQSVLLAAQEVESSLAAFFGATKQSEHIDASRVSAQRALDLAQMQYKEGSSTFTRVLDSQFSLAAAMDALAAVQGLIATNLIATHKALGGGWEVRREREMIPEETKVEMRARTDWGSLLDSDYVEGSDFFIPRHDPDAALRTQPVGDAAPTDDTVPTDGTAPAADTAPTEAK